MSRQSADQGKRLTGEHLLDRLPRHSELSGDIGLGQTIVNQHLHQVAALNFQRPRLTCVFDGLSSDLFDAPENLLVCASVMVHGFSVTTIGCHRQLAVVMDLSNPPDFHMSDRPRCRTRCGQFETGRAPFPSSGAASIV